MYHGILFNPDGSVSEIPGQDIIPPNARVRSYPVTERYGWVWVWMGDPAMGDDSLIPDLIGLDNPDYVLGHGHLDYDAAATLISENLLDFSHTAYVHAASFKLGEVMAEEHAEVSAIDGGISYLRWIQNWGFNAAGDVETPGDMFMAYDYLIPGILRMDLGSFPAGTAKKLNLAAPNLYEAQRDHLAASHAVTPLDDKTTRYFFMYGSHKRLGNEETVRPIVDNARKAFAEDKRMIEAQQRVMETTANPTMIPTAHDRTITLYNRMVNKLVRAEAEAEPAAAA